MRTTIFTTYCLLFILYGCNNHKSNDYQDSDYVNVLKDCAVIAQYKVINGDSVFVCDINAIKDEIEIPFSSLLTSYEIIALDTCKESFCSPDWGRAYPSENYIAVKAVEEPIRLFDRKTGKYLHTVGNIGQGPAEYISASQIQIEEDSNIVLIKSSFPNRIMQYELSTGQYQKNYKLIFNSGSIFYFNLKDREITSMGCPYPSHKEGTLCFWKQTPDGNLIQGLSGVKQLGCSRHNRGTGHLDNRSNSYQVLLWDTTHIKQDTLYHYDLKENRLIPAFTVEWGDKIPTHSFVELPHYYYCNITDKSDAEFLIDKRTGKGAKIKFKLDMFGKEVYLHSLRTYYRNSYEICFLFDPLEIADALNEEEQKNRIAGKIMNPTDLQDENSWIFIGKWN